MTQKEPQLVRRIDRNTVFGDKTAALKLTLSDETKTHFIYRVGGSAIGLVRGKSRYVDKQAQEDKTSEWIKLVGRFKAMNLRGESFIAGAAFLPGDLATTIADKLDNNESRESVVFLFDVFIRHDKQLATGYGYIIEPVRAPDAIDPLDTLFADAKPLMLEGPDTEADTAKKKK